MFFLIKKYNIHFILTYETVGTGAIVRCNSVVARTTVETRIRPTIVPIDLAVYPGVAVDAVTRVGTERWISITVQSVIFLCIQYSKH